MISFFTDPYNGELITHAIARYIEYQKSSITSGLSQLFSTYKITACLSFGNNIDDLVAIVGGKYTSDYLINNHTILPYYKLFCTNKKYQALYSYIRRGNQDEKVSSASLIQVNQCLKKSLVYCEECIREDIKIHGETYLHREHYLCGVSTCYKHKVPLLEYETIINHFKATLSQVKIVGQLGADKRKDDFKDDYKVSIGQTELAVEILNSQVDIYREDLTEIYISRLKKLGLIIEEDINYREIDDILYKLYGDVGVTILKIHLNPQNIGKHLFLNTKNFIDPSIHLLFIKALWKDDNEFIKACIEQGIIRQNRLKEREEDCKQINSAKGKVKYSKTYTSIICSNDCTVKVIGTANRYVEIIENEMLGPWKCKDVICKNEIKESTITYNANKKQLRQEIRCRCGCYYIVSVGVEEKRGNNRTIIMDYSHQVRGIIVEHYLEKGMGYRKIGNELGVPTSYVKKCIESEDVAQHAASKYKMLEMEMPLHEEAINYFWKDYMEFIVDFPNTHESRFVKIIWDEYKKTGEDVRSLEEFIIEKHKKIIDDSKGLVNDYRKKKRKIKTCIADNKALVMAIAYLKLFDKDELTNIVLESSSKVTDEDIERLIVSIEDERAGGIEVTRERIWKKYPKEMKYFVEKYPGRADEILPNKNTSRNKLGKNKKVKSVQGIKESDNIDKDAYYEILIKGANEELRKEDFPIKITKTLIRRKLGGLKVGELDEEKYPRAVAAINQVCESSLEYRLRVCKYVIDKKELSSQYVSLNEIFKEAKIKDSKIYNKIRDDVIQYLEEKKKLL